MERRITECDGDGWTRDLGTSWRRRTTVAAMDRCACNLILYVEMHVGPRVSTISNHGSQYHRSHASYVSTHGYQCVKRSPIMPSFSFSNSWISWISGFAPLKVIFLTILGVSPSWFTSIQFMHIALTII